VDDVVTGDVAERGRDDRQIDTLMPERELEVPEHTVFQRHAGREQDLRTGIDTAVDGSGDTRRGAARHNRQSESVYQMGVTQGHHGQLVAARLEIGSVASKLIQIIAGILEPNEKCPTRKNAARDRRAELAVASGCAECQEAFGGRTRVSP